MSKLINITVISIMIIFLLVANVYGFENDIFKIDIPSEYAAFGYSGMETFIKSEDIGIMIYAHEAVGLKKDISTMSKSEIKEIIGDIISDDATILEETKEKLGKSKAIKARVKSDDSYMDIYIVVSDKHVLLVAFTAPSESELDSEEFTKIKKSFKMKEGTTNVTLIRVGIIIVILIFAVIKYRKKFMNNNVNYM